jgi:hypothetical protein
MNNQGIESILNELEKNYFLKERLAKQQELDI